MTKGPLVDFNIYLITKGDLVDDSETGAMLNNIESALKGGVRAVQLREKEPGGAKLLGVASELRELTSRYEAKLFINDRVDVALLSGADGVHLAVTGLGARDVREFLDSRGEELLIGVSTHNMEEALEAERKGADFITFGPIFQTPSKTAYGAPLGLDKLSEVTGRLNIPVFAIGGINSERVLEVKRRGAEGAAMISAILSAKDIEKSTKLIIGKEENKGDSK